MQFRTRVGFLIAVFAVLAAACSGGDDGEGTTTTATEATITTLADAGAAGSGSEDDSSSQDTTTTSVVVSDEEDDGVAVPTFSIVSREEGEDGDTVVVLLDTESYDTLTDIDLQNVVSVVVDDFPPVYEAHVVDSEEVTALVVAPASDIDAEAQRLMDLHYLVRLEEGFRIVYVGPFEDTPSAILGS